MSKKDKKEKGEMEIEMVPKKMMKKKIMKKKC